MIHKKILYIKSHIFSQNLKNHLDGGAEGHGSLSPLVLITNKKTIVLSSLGAASLRKGVCFLSPEAKRVVSLRKRIAFFGQTSQKMKHMFGFSVYLANVTEQYENQNILSVSALFSHNSSLGEGSSYPLAREGIKKQLSFREGEKGEEAVELMKPYVGKFFNQCFDKGRLKNFVLWFLLNYGEHKTVSLVEQLKNIGFEYASKAGISLGVDDLKIPPKKANLIYDAENQTNLTVVQYRRGEITGVERFQRLIDTWHRTSEVLKQEVIDNFEETDILNPVYMMAFSGARGNISQVRQLVGMRGLMADPQGQIIDFPIRSNFREGLTVTEYIISSYGARKGIVDTALRTANAGYLTRRLVDVAQHVIISNFDCGTTRGIFLTNMKEGNKTIHSLSQRMVGRILARDLFEVQQPLPSLAKPSGEIAPIVKTHLKIASRNEEITLDLATQLAKKLAPTQVQGFFKMKAKIFVRSPLTCEKPICQLCYGWSLAQGQMVSIGEAVGVVAAQSIGEPGTQLTMRTFHTGGVFSGDVSDQIKAPFDGIIQYISAIPGTLIRTPEGKIAFLTKSEGSFLVKKVASSLNTNQTEEAFLASKNKTEMKKFTIPHHTLLYIRNGQNVYEKEVIAQISSISQKTNATDDAELTIKSEIEGQFYSKFLGFREKIVGPAKLKSSLSTGKDLKGKTEKIYEAWTWGYAWILSGKIYDYKNSSSFQSATPSLSIVGDLLNTKSLMTQTQWSISSRYRTSISFDYNKRTPSFVSRFEKDEHNFASTVKRGNENKKEKAIPSETTQILFMDLNNMIFQKYGYILEVSQKNQFITNTNMNHSFGKLRKEIQEIREKEKHNDFLFLSPSSLPFRSSNVSPLSGNVQKLPYIVQWFPNQYQTELGGFIVFENGTFPLQLEKHIASFPRRSWAETFNEQKSPALTSVREENQNHIDNKKSNQSQFVSSVIRNRHLFLKTREIKSSKILFVPSDVFKFSTVTKTNLRTYFMSVFLNQNLNFLPSFPFGQTPPSLISSNPTRSQTITGKAIKTTGENTVSGQKSNLTIHQYSQIFHELSQKKDFQSLKSHPYVSIVNTVNKRGGEQASHFSVTPKNQSRLVSKGNREQTNPTFPYRGSSKYGSYLQRENQNSSILLKIKKSIKSSHSFLTCLPCSFPFFDKDQGKNSQTFPYFQSKTNGIATKLSFFKQIQFQNFTSFCKTVAAVPYSQENFCFPSLCSTNPLKQENKEASPLFSPTGIGWLGKKGEIFTKGLAWHWLNQQKEKTKQPLSQVKGKTAKQKYNRILFFLNSIYSMEKTVTVSIFLEKFYNKFQMVKNPSKFYSFVFMKPCIDFQNHLNAFDPQRGLDKATPLPFSSFPFASEKHKNQSPSLSFHPDPPLEKEGDYFDEGIIGQGVNRTAGKRIRDLLGELDSNRSIPLVFPKKILLSVESNENQIQTKFITKKTEVVFHGNLKKGWVVFRHPENFSVSIYDEQNQTHLEPKFNQTNVTRFHTNGNSVKSVNFDEVNKSPFSKTEIKKGKRIETKQSNLNLVNTLNSIENVHQKMIYAGQSIFNEISFHIPVFVESLLFKNRFNINTIYSFSNLGFFSYSPAKQHLTLLAKQPPTGVRESGAASLRKSELEAAPFVDKRSSPFALQEKGNNGDKEGSVLDGTKKSDCFPYGPVGNGNKKGGMSQNGRPCLNWIVNKKIRYNINAKFTDISVEERNNSFAHMESGQHLKQDDYQIQKEKNRGYIGFLFQPIKEFQPMNDFEIKNYTYESTINVFNNSYIKKLSSLYARSYNSKLHYKNLNSLIFSSPANQDHSQTKPSLLSHFTFLTPTPLAKQPPTPYGESGAASPRESGLEAAPMPFFPSLDQRKGGIMGIKKETEIREGGQEKARRIFQRNGFVFYPGKNHRANFFNNLLSDCNRKRKSQSIPFSSGFLSPIKWNQIQQNETYFVSSVSHGNGSQNKQLASYTTSHSIFPFTPTEIRRSALPTAGRKQKEGGSYVEETVAKEKKGVATLRMEKERKILVNQSFDSLLKLQQFKTKYLVKDVFSTSVREVCSAKEEPKVHQSIAYEKTLLFFSSLIVKGKNEMFIEKLSLYETLVFINSNKQYENQSQIFPSNSSHESQTLFSFSSSTVKQPLPFSKQNEEERPNEDEGRNQEISPSFPEEWESEAALTPQEAPSWVSGGKRACSSDYALLLFVILSIKQSNIMSFVQKGKPSFSSLREADKSDKTIKTPLNSLNLIKQLKQLAAISSIKQIMSERSLGLKNGFSIQSDLLIQTVLGCSISSLVSSLRSITVKSEQVHSNIEKQPKIEKSLVIGVHIGSQKPGRFFPFSPTEKGNVGKLLSLVSRKKTNVSPFLIQHENMGFLPGLNSGITSFGQTKPHSITGETTSLTPPPKSIFSSFPFDGNQGGLREDKSECGLELQPRNGFLNSVFASASNLSFGKNEKLNQQIDNENQGQLPFSLSQTNQTKKETVIVPNVPQQQDLKLSYLPISKFDCSLYPFLSLNFASILDFYLLNAKQERNVNSFVLNSQNPKSLLNLTQTSSFSTVKYKEKIHSFFNYAVFNSFLNNIFESPCFSLNFKKYMDLSAFKKTKTQKTEFLYNYDLNQNICSVSSSNPRGAFVLSPPSTGIKKQPYRKEGLASNPFFTEGVGGCFAEGKEFDKEGKVEIALSKKSYQRLANNIQAKTNYYSPFKGEIVYSQTIAPKDKLMFHDSFMSDAIQSSFSVLSNSKIHNYPISPYPLRPTGKAGLKHQKRVASFSYSCMFLTKQDLVSYYLPNHHAAKKPSVAPFLNGDQTRFFDFSYPQRGLEAAPAKPIFTEVGEEGTNYSQSLDKFSSIAPLQEKEVDSADEKKQYYEIKDTLIQSKTKSSRKEIASSFFGSLETLNNIEQKSTENIASPPSERGGENQTLDQVSNQQIQTIQISKTQAGKPMITGSPFKISNYNYRENREQNKDGILFPSFTVSVSNQKPFLPLAKQPPTGAASPRESGVKTGKGDEAVPFSMANQSFGKNNEAESGIGGYFVGENEVAPSLSDPHSVSIALPSGDKEAAIGSSGLGNTMKREKFQAVTLLGDFYCYGDLISQPRLSKNHSENVAIQVSGQVIHYNKTKITIRRAQPVLISPKGILHKFDGDFIDPKSPVITLSYQRLKTGDIIQGIPKVEQFFEARTTKRGRLFRDSLPSLLKALFQRYQSQMPLELAVRQSFYKIQQIIVDGVQRVYKSQGVTISDKHLEVIVKQMTSKVRIIDGAQTGFFPGEVVDLTFVEKINTFLIKKMTYEPVVLGITKASLEVDSFLSASSFQQTTRILSQAAMYRKKDFLKGLKENVILGNLIPAGTGYLVYLDDF